MTTSNTPKMTNVDRVLQAINCLKKNPAAQGNVKISIERIQRMDQAIYPHDTPMDERQIRRVLKNKKPDLRIRGRRVMPWKNHF